MGDKEITVKVPTPVFPVWGLLGVAFVVLKLTEVVDWSWVWVLAPFWLPFAFSLSILALAATFFGMFLVAGFIVAALGNDRGRRGW